MIEIKSLNNFIFSGNFHGRGFIFLMWALLIFSFSASQPSCAATTWHDKDCIENSSVDISGIGTTTNITLSADLPVGTVLYQLTDYSVPISQIHAAFDGAAFNGFMIRCPYAKNGDQYQMNNPFSISVPRLVNTIMSATWKYKNVSIFNGTCRVGVGPTNCNSMVNNLFPITVKKIGGVEYPGVWINPNEIKLTFKWTYVGPGPIGGASSGATTYIDPFASISGAFEPNEGRGGNVIHFAVRPGRITIKPCSVDTSFLTDYRYVALDPTQASSFSGVGSTDNATAKMVHFSMNCLPETWARPPKVTITSVSSPGTGGTNELPLDPGVRSPASGVRFALYDAAGAQPLPLNKPVAVKLDPSTYSIDHLWKTGIDFMVKYKQVSSPMQSGELQSSINLNIEYQ
jgi:hypothetical protein